jgi:hypothetical protein
MTRVFYDFEFIEHDPRTWPFGRRVWTVEPISLGIKIEDGPSYYAVFRDAPWRKIKRHLWLRDNVLPHLPPAYSATVRPHAQITAEVAELLGAVSDVELWAWYAAFDHVSLAWLWGPMSELPPGVPMYTNDLMQRAKDLGNPIMPTQSEGVHNALEDAKFNEIRAKFLDDVENGFGLGFSL